MFHSSRLHSDSCESLLVVARLLRMTISIPRLVRLAAGLLLPLAAISSHAQDWAKARLEASPRHHEYVALKHDNRTVQAFVVYPEVKHKATVVILIHEIFGLSDWAKEMADDLAAEGFIVVAPHLLPCFGPNGGGASEFPTQDATVKAVSGLDPNGVNADLDAAADYAKHIPAADGKIATVGFCWGGGKSFAFATHRDELSAAFVFYGPLLPSGHRRYEKRMLLDRQPPGFQSPERRRFGHVHIAGGPFRPHGLPRRRHADGAHYVHQPEPARAPAFWQCGRRFRTGRQHPDQEHGL